MTDLGPWFLAVEGAALTFLGGLELAEAGRSPPATLLGWTVADGFDASPAADEVRRRFRREVLGWTAAALVVAGVLAAAVSSNWGADGAGGMLLAIGALFVQEFGLSRARARVRRIAVAHAAEAEPVTVRRASLAPPPDAFRPLLGLGGLLPLAAAGLWLHAHWSELPPSLPVHWSALGPDRWRSATPDHVYGPLFDGATLILFLTGMSWLTWAQRPAGTTPRERAKRAVLADGFIDAGWLYGLAVATVALTALTQEPGMVPVVAAGGLLAMSVARAPAVLRLGRLPADAREWAGGGIMELFHASPDDPAWVTERHGEGHAPDPGTWLDRAGMPLVVLASVALTLGARWLVLR